MSEKFFLKNSEDRLFIFEMANNHQGDLTHAFQIIDALGNIVKRTGVRAALKLQLRQLDSFIFPARKNHPNKHIKRFLETELQTDQFRAVVDRTRTNGLVPMSTVFDEASIPVFQELGFEILKIGSCSAKDYPLLRALSRLTQPTILSTAGLTMDEISRAVWTLGKKPDELAIMHCVGVYPTALEALNLTRIEQIRKAFPGHAIGFSTHEAPNEQLPVQLAYAVGARIFEKHVGIPTAKQPLNAYSATPEQVESWIESQIASARIIHRDPQLGGKIESEEQSQLQALERAVFSLSPLKTGQTVQSSDLGFAIPGEGDQLKVSDLFTDSMQVKSDIGASVPIPRSALAALPLDPMNEVLRMYTDLTLRSGIRLKEGVEAQISCHRGQAEISRTGALLITLLNGVVCKKYLILARGQVHPVHRHPDREEFMRLVYGDSEAKIGSEWKPIPEDDYLHIPLAVDHAFRTREGAVIEEITTKYQPRTSLYLDAGLELKKVRVVWVGGRWRSE